MIATWESHVEKIQKIKIKFQSNKGSGAGEARFGAGAL